MVPGKVKAPKSVQSEEWPEICAAARPRRSYLGLRPARHIEKARTSQAALALAADRPALVGEKILGPSQHGDVIFVSNEDDGGRVSS